MECIYPVVEERTGREQEDLSGPVRNGGLTLLQGRKGYTPTRFAPFDKVGQGLDRDEEHLGEGEGRAYFRGLPEKLLVRPYIPEESNAIRRKLTVDAKALTSNNRRI